MIYRQDKLGCLHSSYFVFTCDVVTIITSLLRPKVLTLQVTTQAGFVMWVNEYQVVTVV